MKYSYSFALGSGVPLGGIGTGSFEIRADGRFYEWTIFNNGGYAERQDIRSTYYLNEKDSFFAVRSNGKVRILQSYNYYYGASPYTTPWLRPIREIEFIGEPPIAYLTFKDSFTVNMKAFSPFIPHDLKNSSLPVAIFKLSTQGQSDFIFAIKNPFEKGKIRTSNDTVIFAGEVDSKDPRYNGNLCVRIIAENPFTARLSYFKQAIAEYVPYPISITEWNEFRTSGKISSDGGNDLGVIGGRGKEVTVIISWYFPNHLLTDGRKIGHYYENFFNSCVEVIDYVQTNLNYLDSKTTQFHDLLYQANGIESWIPDLVGSQLTTLIKSTWLGKDGFFGIWEGYYDTADERKVQQGTYYDGPVHTALNTLDVMAYFIYSIIVLFPELAKQLLKVAETLDENKPEYLIYALAIPENKQKYLERLAKDPSLSTTPEKLLAAVKEIVKETGKDPKGRIRHFLTDNLKPDEYHMTVMNPEFVLMWYLTSKMTGDKEFFSSLYEKAKEAIDSVLRTHSYDGILYHRLPAGIEWMRKALKTFGTIRGISNPVLFGILGQDILPMSLTTYDDWTAIGISSISSIIWTSALHVLNQASIELGRDVKYEVPLDKIIKYLWNGEYFNLWYDPISGYRDKASNASQLLGEWYLALLGDRLLDKEMTKKVLSSIVKYNLKPEEGVLNGAYPDGYRPLKRSYENPLNLEASIHFDTPWTGVEFYLASHLIFEKMVNEGIKVLKEIYDRYSIAGHFWNHVEWGEHYSRPLSSLTVIPAFEGVKYDGMSNTLTIDPAVNNLSWILLLPSAWGKIEIKEKKEVKITIFHGELTLKRLKIPYKPKSIKVNGRYVDFKAEEELVDELYEVSLNVTLKEGDVLEIH